MKSETESGAWTIARLLSWTREYLERNAIESPRLCAELLLAHALNCRRIELFTRHESAPDAAALARFRESVREAGNGKPIAYLTGTREFFSLSFEVTPDVLIPRPETEVLVERTISLLRSAGTPPRLVDIGTGSGCIAISLAKHLPHATIFASDASAAALSVARRNAERIGVQERITFAQGNLLEAWPAGERFDVIVSNPPYLARSRAAELPRGVREFEPSEALFGGEDGLELIRELVAQSAERLLPGGHLLFEIAYDQADAVQALLGSSVWEATTTYRDTLEHQRVVHARVREATKHSGAGGSRP